MTTIREVARAAGCSAATVSLVINGSPRQIGRDTRARVLKTIRELGYRPRVPEGQTTRSRVIGVLYQGSSAFPANNAYFRPIIDGLFESVLAHEYGILFFARLNWENSLRTIREQFDGRCDGLVLVAPVGPCPFISNFKERGLSIVVLASYGDNPDVSSVNTDDYGGATMGVRYLVKMGHRQIGFFEGSAPFQTAIARASGFRDACENLGLLAEKCPSYEGHYGWESGYERAQYLISHVPRSEWPTALFCAGDTIARGALKAMAEAGIGVPEELSIMGFDDLPNPASTDLPLTSVAQPLFEMSREACDLVIDEAESGSREIVKIVKQPSIVERSSVRKIS